MTVDGPLPSIEQLTGHDLRALKKALGRPFLEAIDSDFEEALYAYVWVGEKRHAPDLTRDEVLDRPFSEMVKAFEEANNVEDPTTPPSGDD